MVQRRFGPALRIKTSRTLKSIDNWKKRFDLRNNRFLAAVSILILAASYSNGQFLVLAFIIIAISVHYAAIQFGCLILLGFLSAKLTMYRFTNTLLKGIRLQRSAGI
jgi:hypothetical protein